MLRLTCSVALLLAIVGVSFAHHRPVKIVIADAVFTVFDLDAKDVFIFTGPAPVAVGQVIGLRADGSEFRILPTPPPQPAAPATAKGETGPRPKIETPNLPSLAPACASCHSEGGKVRGSFTLFGTDGKIKPGVDWKLVRDVISKSKDAPGRMPPPEENKPDVTAADKATVKRLADG